MKTVAIAAAILTVSATAYAEEPTQKTQNASDLQVEVAQRDGTPQVIELTNEQMDDVVAGSSTWSGYWYSGYFYSSSVTRQSQTSTTFDNTFSGRSDYGWW